MIGPKPKISQVDGPAEGDSCVFHMIFTIPGAPPVVDATALLGPGRDYLDMDEARKGLIQTDQIISTLHGPYSTITALLAEFPEAKIDGTAKRMLAAERAREEQIIATAKWEAAVEAAGLEPCDRCGGAGGWKGWPGYTCYECGGCGTQKKEAE